jgi:putative ABC transport system permease protein
MNEREMCSTANSLPRRSLFWRLWWRSISVKHPQALLAIGSLLVGAAVTSMLLNLYGGVRRKMTEEFRSYGANVVLAPVESASSSATGVDGVMNEAALQPLERISQRTPGIVAVPILYGVVHVKRVTPDPRLPDFENVVAAGTDFADLRRLNTGWQIDAGKVHAEAGDLAVGACAAGAHLAARLHVGVGDSVVLQPVDPEAGGEVSQADTYRIALILSTGTSEDDQVFVPLLKLQNLLGTPGKISLAELSVPGETAQVEQTVRELSSLLPGVEVRPIRQIVYTEGKVLGTIRWLLLSLTALILVIIAICVMATMTAIVLERRRDIGVMKALGASDSAVMRLFVAEGAGLGFVAGVAGFFLGGMLARGVGERLFGVSLNLSWWTLPVVSIVTVLLAVMATLFPVRVVRAIQPAVVLKGE